ncbi:MAG: FKBP-type peptidyl-prolyl cis-trans isomerase [Lachnospiraceae bacterium]|nr:FKBP-type peptidyl-prolyl cis-trans isomerase [Lachnospiraceae bacterium]
MEDNNQITDLLENIDITDSPEKPDNAVSPESTDVADSAEITDVADSAESADVSPEEGFYNVEVSDEEADRELSSSKEKSKISMILVASFALLAVIITVIILVPILKSGDSDIATVPSGNNPESIDQTTVPGVPDETPSTSTDSDVTTESEASKPIDYTDYGVTVTLGDYKNLSMEVPKVTVTDDELADEEKSFIEDLGLVELREITDRPAQMGDIVIVDFDGLVDGEPQPGTTGTDFELELGSNRTIDGFESGIVGIEIGGSKVLNLEFPDPYPNNPDFSGKPVDFTITVKKIRERYYPELTDELVSSNTSYKTVQEYRDNTKAELLASKEEEASERAFESTIDALIDSCTFSPEIDVEIADRMEYYRDFYDNYFMQSFGVDALTYSGLTKEDYDGMLNQIATPEVKYPYVYKEIARQEGYSPSEEEKQAKFDEIFYDMYGFESEEDIYKSFTKKMCDISVEHELLSSYGYHWLRNKLGMHDD